ACGSEFSVGHVDDVLIDLLREALAAAPVDSGLRAQLKARLAAAMQPAANPAEPLRLGAEAIAEARTAGDDRLLLEVIHSAMSAFMDFLPADQRAPLNDESERLATRLHDRRRRLRAF